MTHTLVVGIKTLDMAVVTLQDGTLVCGLQATVPLLGGAEIRARFEMSAAEADAMADELRRGAAIVRSGEVPADLVVLPADADHDARAAAVAANRSRS
jgi:hypothetical protein